MDALQMKHMETLTCRVGTVVQKKREGAVLGWMLFK